MKTGSRSKSAGDRFAADPSRRLRRLYVAALAAVAGLTIISQTYVQAVIRRQANDAPVINTAGRQRMLSQKIAKAALTLQAFQLDGRGPLGKELREAMDLWEASQSRLRFGGDGRHRASDDARINAAFSELQPHQDAILAAGRALLRDAAAGRPLDRHVSQILDHETAFLPQMHAIVGDLDAEAQRRVERLKAAELVLMAVTLLVLLAEAMLVFEPAARTIRRQFREALDAAEARATAAVLEQSNHRLRAEIRSRERSEAALRVSKEAVDKLALVASGTRHGVVVTDREGRVEYVNDAFRRVADLSDRDPTGRLVGDFISAVAGDPRPGELVAEAVRREVAAETEVTLDADEDRTLHMLLEIEPVTDDEGGVTQFILTQTDITARKRHESELRAAKRSSEDARRLAEDANQAKSAFLANMSHEIRTPLNGILGYAEVLRAEGHTDEERRDYVDTIHSSGRHLLTLINDILDLSKIEAGRMEFEAVTCSPDRVIREVVSVLRVQALEKGLRLDTRWGPGVPRAIVSDPDRLRQMLMNLVGNAIKFTENGGVTIAADVDHTDGEQSLIVAVIDTGIGIDPDHHERIFDPFDQSDTSITRQFGGTGLGLAICKSIVEGLGGAIELESRPGWGSTFRVRLPVGSPDESAPLEEYSEALVASRDADPRTAADAVVGAEILLCEDGDTNRQLIGLVLRDAGARVTFAENGQEGVDAVREAPDRFDLILMDMQMPVLDGYSATRLLRGDGWNGPIVALTAHAMRGDEAKCLAAGCSGYLTKPIQIQSLVAAVANALPQTTGPADEPKVDLSLAAEGPIRSTLPLEGPEFRPIVDSFVDTLTDRIDAMIRALDDGEADVLAEHAHWLRGAGGTIGFDCFTEPCRDLELASKSEDLTAAAAPLSTIRGLADRIETPESQAETVA